jgi:TP901 family phage tail tape measure protein
MAKAIPLPVVQTGFEQSVEAGKKAVGTINLPVNLDSSAFKNLNQPLGKITGLATEFEKSIAASNARVLAFGASVGILNAVSKSFKSILDNGIAVEKALADIGVISGQSAAQLDKLGDALFNVAKNTSQSFNTAAKAALEFSRQGLSVEETVKRTNDALTLTRFTSLSAADAVDTLTAAVNSFAGAGITTTQILNKLIAVDSAFAVSAEDLANGLARAGSIAQEVGVTFDELNGLITVAQEKTARGGAVIGNALKTIFTRVRSDETVSALRAIGVESLDTAGNLRDVVPILTDLSVKLKDLSGGERIQILEAVASKYNINILSALLGDIGNAQGQFSKALGVSLGASNEAFNRQVELNKLLDVALNQAAVSAGELANNLAKIGVNDNLKSLVGYVNSFLDSINKLLTSDDTGGDLARGIIKGFADVLFKVGLPVIAAIFIKLTKDIATFGIESLQTILGINQKVKERQSLEQAVTATLISNKGIMDQILAASGDQVKQQAILLKAYGDQIAALKTIQSISASVAPALQGAGLVVTPNGVGKKDGAKGKAAEGYLPAQEAADIRRGVGGASSSSKVVSIPNFAFGGGKKGTMIANTSEYVVPNFANGGSAIFNQDMVKAYGLPAGAQKIGAAGGYVPNFAKYIYDSDRIPADKNATLKAILASSAKKNLLIAPAGAGKSTLAAGMGTFLTGAADVANATEIDILSGAGRTKDGGLSKNLESIMAAVNASGGKVSYLYTKNLDILSRRAGRTDPSEGDLRSKKQIAGTAYAPLNQFDFMGMVKSKANSFSMVRGAKGFVPNFADVNEPERFAALIGKKSGSDNGLLNRYSLWASQDSQGKVQVSDIAKPTSGDEQNGKLIKFNAYGVPSKSDKQLTDVKQQLSEYGKNSAVQLAQNMTSQALPSDFVQGKLAATFNPGSLSSFAGTIFEASVGALLGDKSFKDYSEQAVTSAFDLDIRSNQNIKKDFKIPDDVDFLEVKGSDSPPLIKSIAKKIYQVTELNRAAVSKRKIGNTELKQLGMQRPLSDLDKLIVIENGKTTQFGSQKELEDYVSSKYTKNVGNSTIAGSPKFGENVWPSIGPRTKRGAGGYIPNFAQGGPLEDAIQREMDAGLDPSQIRVTTDGKLKNSKNPSGFAVINTRDEPNGKIPNFAVRAPAGAVDASGKNIGGRFISQANPSSYSEPIGPEREQSKKAELSAMQLVGVFSALQFAVSTLEGTFAKANTTSGKFIAAISAIGSGASTGGIIGGAISQSTERFVGRGGALGMLGAAGKFAGPAGVAIGAGVAAYNMRQDALTGPQKERDQELADYAATREKEAVYGGVTDPKEKAKLAKQRLDNFQKLTLINEGEQFQERQKKSAGMDNRFEDATKDLAKSKKEVDRWQGEYDTALQEAADIEARITKDLKDRIAIQENLSAIEIAITNGKIAANQKFNSDINDQLKLSYQLGDSEKIRLDNSIAIQKLEQEKNSISRETIGNILSEVSQKSALGTADKEALKLLIERLQTGESIASVEEELKKINIQNVLAIKEILNKKITEEQKAKLILDSQIKITEENQATNEQLRIRVNLMKLEARAADERLSSERKFRDTIQSGSSAIEQAAAETPLALKQNEISKKPYASKTDEADIANLTAALQLYTQTKQIDETFDKTKAKSLDELQDSYKGAVEGISFSDLALKQSILNDIKKAKTLEDLNFALQRLGEAAAMNGEEQYGLDFAVEQGTVSLKQYNTEVDNAAALKAILIQKIKDEQTYELKLINLRKTSPAKVGAIRAINDISKEADNFTETFSYNTTIGFRDGLRDALDAAVSGTDDLRGALQGVAQGFLKTMQQAFLNNAVNNAMKGLGDAFPSFFKLSPPDGKAKGGYIQKFANGGFVSGGSGIRDDVPAMLSAGEYVMRKSAVQKYGAENIAKMNNGGIFLPGVRGGSEISGYDQLSKFANQTTTSGATDVLKGQRSAAFANLEDQSVRLSRFGLMNEDTIKGEITSAQQQGLELIAQREAYRTQQRKAMQQQLVGTALSLAINLGVSKLGSKFGAAKKVGATVGGAIDNSAPDAYSGRAYGGLIRGFNNGGGPTDDIPALLMGGEYVMDRATVRKYGKQYLDSMNSGRAKFAEGGYAGAEAETTTESTDSKAKVDANTGTAVNISINVSGGNSSTESQGQTSQGGVDYKKMSERIKAVVLETLNEEKRLGGSLRTR